jgi:hypothetical protein
VLDQPDDPRPATLDYMSREEPSALGVSGRRFVAGCMGILFLVLGLPLVLNGIVLLVRGLKEWNRFTRSDDGYSGMLGLGFGVFCMIVGFRWTWYAFRRPPRK